MIYSIIAADRRKPDRKPTPGLDETVQNFRGKLYVQGVRIDRDPSGNSTNANVLSALEFVPGQPWINVLKGSIDDYKVIMWTGPVVTSEAEWLAHCEAQAIKDAESAKLRQLAEDEARAKWEAEHPEGLV